MDTETTAIFVVSSSSIPIVDAKIEEGAKGDTANMMTYQFI